MTELPFLYVRYDCRVLVEKRIASAHGSLDNRKI